MANRNKRSPDNESKKSPPKHNKRTGSKNRDRTYRRDDAKKQAAQDVNDSAVSGGSMSSLNDLSWYAHNPALLAAAASLPFPYRPGMGLPVAGLANGDAKFGIPGIFVISWNPVFGQANGSPTDPIALAAKELYGRVRNAFSGRIYADPPDFVIYLGALDSIFSAIGSLKRIFRTISSYSPENYMLPDALLQALGIAKDNVSAWITGRMDLFMYINELVAYSRKLRCPDVMDLLRRHYWMNDNIYLDAPQANAQMYVFKQTSYYKFKLIEGTAGVQSGGLSLVDINYASPATAYESVKQLIDALAGSEDAYTISGYLMRAFDGSSEFRVDEVTLLEQLTPVYVPEVLTQIENARKPIGFSAPTISDLTQNPANNSLTQSVTLSIAKSGDTGALLAGLLPKLYGIVSLPMQLPSAADVVIATRLQFAYGAFTATDTGVTCSLSCPTEVVTDMRIFYYSWNGSKPFVANLVFDTDVAYTTSSTIVGNDGVLLVAGPFDWHPLQRVFTYTKGTPPAITNSYVLGDVKNITSIEPDTLANIHRVCVLSELNTFGI